MLLPGTCVDDRFGDSEYLFVDDCVNTDSIRPAGDVSHDNGVRGRLKLCLLVGILFCNDQPAGHGTRFLADGACSDDGATIIVCRALKLFDNPSTTAIGCEAHHT